MWPADNVSGLSRRVRALEVWLLVAASGIGGAGAVSSQQPVGVPVLPRTRSAAGVVIFEHDASALTAAPRFTLSPRPIATVGGAADANSPDLSSASSVVLLASGRVAAFSPQDSHFFAWDPRTGRTWVYGRRGTGPGEYSRVMGLAAGLGDTVLVFDASSGHLDRILVETGLVRSEGLAGRLPSRVQYLLGQLPAGRFVLFAPGLVQDGIPGRNSRATASVLLLDPTGTVRSIATLPDLEITVVESRYGGRRQEILAPLGNSRLAQAIVWDTLIGTTSQDAFSVDLRTAEGKVVSSLRVQRPRRPMTPAIREATILREMDRLRNQVGERLRDPQEAERQRREMAYADSMPAMGRMHLSPERILWVMDPLAPGDTVWFATAFRQDGAILGRLSGPGHTPPVAFGPDRVVLRSEDANGIVAFQLHSLVPAGAFRSVR